MVQQRAAVNRKDFRAPWGRVLKVVSAAATAVLAAVAGGPFVFTEMPMFAKVLIIAASAAIFFSTLLFVVRGYELRGDTLVVKRLFWETTLPLAGLTEIIEQPNLRGSIRLMGNGGLFSFTGWYWNARLGKYRAFLTDFRRAVGLRVGDRIVVISPEPPSEFAAAVRERFRI